MDIILKNGTAIFADGLLKNASVFIKGSKIQKRLLRRFAPRNDGVITIDARGCFISPGFIDTHIHGEPNEIFLNERKYGTTSYLIAQSCGSPAFIRKKIDRVRNFSKDHAPCGCLLGLRLEGPYINKKMAGAQDKRFIAAASVKGLTHILQKGRGIIRMVTLAPELKGAKGLIKTCLKHKVIPSIGHSDASYSQAHNAFSSGIRHVTHIFNAISGPRHGSAGASIAALFDDRVAVEVIADLKHVKKALLKTLFALKNKDKIILVTDSVRAASSGHKTGSRLTMIGAIKNVVKHCGVDIADAVKMASLNPAKIFGIERKKGSLEPGKNADIVIFDKNFQVKFTMIGGKIVHNNLQLKTNLAIARRKCAA